jgi:predicted permease
MNAVIPIPMLIPISRGGVGGDISLMEIVIITLGVLYLGAFIFGILDGLTGEKTTRNVLTLLLFPYFIGFWIGLILRLPIGGKR